MSEAWTVKRLGDVIVPCGTVDPTKEPDRLFRYVDVSGVSNETFEIVEAQTIKGRDAPSRARRQIRSGDVLFATIRPTLKRIAVVPPELDGEVCSTGYFVFRPHNGLDGKFLYYYLFTDGFLEAMEALQTGASYPAVNDAQVKDQKIAFPPLPEQKRIVAILDEAFAGIAAATANAEKNLANARELFERYLNSVFAESAKGWVTRRLGDVFEIGSSKRILETEWTSSGVPFYGGKEIVKLARFGSVTSNAYISEEKYHEYASKYDMPRQGDILMTARGTIGTGYVVRENDRFYYKDGNIISLREKTPTDPDFVLYAFRSSVMADQLGQLTGTTVSHLPIQKAKTLILKMPDFARQKSIASNIRELEKEIANLEELYRRKLAALSSLKQSILQKAFSGDLTGIKTRHCEAA